MRNDIYEKRNDIKAVVGTEASMLSGITLDKQNRLFIGRPLEKAVGVYKYVGYKSKHKYFVRFYVRLGR